jgi:aspartate/methionine/tyrosine aminotransferase
LESGTKSIENESNQYTRAFGNINLVKELAISHEKEFNRELDPMKEILISNGASGCFQIAIQALVNPEDEVIIFEPFYDIYPAQVYLNGAKPVFIPFKQNFHSFDSNDAFQIDYDELKRKITKKTKLIVLK